MALILLWKILEMTFPFYCKSNGTAYSYPLLYIIKLRYHKANADNVYIFHVVVCEYFKSVFVKALFNFLILKVSFTIHPL